MLNGYIDFTHLLSTYCVLGAVLGAGMKMEIDGHNNPLRKGSPNPATGSMMKPLQAVTSAVKETGSREREKGT